MFYLIRPYRVTQASLLSSNVPETVALYAVGTTYALGAQVREDAAGGSVIYESAANGNLGHALVDRDWWIPLGPSNRWAALDRSPGTVTTNADSIEYVIAVEGFADSVVVQGVNAASMQVVQKDSDDVVVFDQTFSLVSPSGILDQLAYFIEPIERLSKQLVMGLKPYANSTVTVTLTGTGGTPSLGQIVIGQSKALGQTRWGGSFGITDYSKKGENEFGDPDIVERAYADRAGFSLWVEDAFLDQLRVLLARYRATPIVWVGDASRPSTLLYGWPDDWAVELTDANRHLLSISLKGLA